MDTLDIGRTIVTDADVGGQAHLVAARQTLPIRLVLALLEAKRLERLNNIRKVNLVKRNLLDAEALRADLARFDDAVGIWPPRHRRKLGCHVQFALFAANLYPGLVGGPRCQHLRVAKAVCLGGIHKVAAGCM